MINQNTSMRNLKERVASLPISQLGSLNHAGPGEDSDITNVRKRCNF